MERKERISQLINQLCSGLHEREEVMKLALLSAIAGESIFLLGPPGVGKSLIARRLKYAFSEARSFEYLMTRFSTPDEVFGPVSIQKLKEEDKYERKTDRYMPGAHIVFLDEIWKASSSIQNALLTIINEKVYRNGEQEVEVHLKSLITASNELPPEGENFGPLYDRLLLRYPMEGIKNAQRFLQMISGTEPVYRDVVEGKFKISQQELEAWHHEIEAVQVEDEVLSVIQIVRQKIEEYNQKQEARRRIQVYDRRWKKIIRLLRTSAFLNQRASVDLMDCFLMVHCLWNLPEQLPVVQELVSETIRKHGYSVSIGLSMLRREVEDFAAEVDREVKIPHRQSEEVLRPVQEEYYALRKNGEDFLGQYLKVSDYNRLKHQEQEVLNLYDQDFKLVNRLQAQKGVEQFTVQIDHNSQRHNLSLQTYQRERTEFLFKAPHPLVEKFWEERFEKIAAYLRAQTGKVQQQAPAPLVAGRGNIFIDEKLLPVVEANHREVLESLQGLELSLEKTRHLYQNAG